MQQLSELPEPMPTATGAAIAALIDGLHAADRPGGAVLSARDGKVIYRGAYGFANIELGVRVEPSMRFRIASVTKQFTTTAILMLVEQGRINLDDDLQTLLPDYPALPHRVTLEHLMTHTSGIKSYTDMPTWVPISRFDLMLEELIPIFRDEPMEFAPGERYVYNNSAYVLLGAIIERVSGQSYEQFLHDHIFMPLDMEHTAYDHTERIVPGRVAGYEHGPDGVQNAAFLSMTQPYAAGALISTVDDLLLWDEALYSERILSRAMLERAHTPVLLNDGTDTGYGYGWSVYDYDSDHVVGHAGGINGFNSYVLRLPREHVFVTVLMNNTLGEPFAHVLAMRVARLVVGKSNDDPEAISLPTVTLDQYAGIYHRRDDEQTTVRREEDHLVIERSDGPPIELWASAEDHFFVRDRFTRVVWTRDDHGTITGYDSLDTAPPDHMTRANPPMPTP